MAQEIENKKRERKEEKKTCMAGITRERK